MLLLYIQSFIVLLYHIQRHLFKIKFCIFFLYKSCFLKVVIVYLREVTLYWKKPIKYCLSHKPWRTLLIIHLVEDTRYWQCCS